ncbi:hypothetical protein LXL04_021201 [Taraxacum kok-saghyz]
MDWIDILQEGKGEATRYGEGDASYDRKKTKRKCVITPAKVRKPVRIDLIDAKTKEPKDTLEWLSKFLEKIMGYLASFEILYDIILEAKLKLDAKIKEATKKFLINPKINDWRLRFDIFLGLHRRWVKKIEIFRQDLPLLISPRLKTPISSERVGSDFEWVPSSPRSLFNCNLREPLPSASSAAASACPFYFVNNNRIVPLKTINIGCVSALTNTIDERLQREGGISGFRPDNTIPFISVTSTIPSIGKNQNGGFFGRVSVIGGSVSGYRSIERLLKQSTSFFCPVVKSDPAHRTNTHKNRPWYSGVLIWDVEVQPNRVRNEWDAIGFDPSHNSFMIKKKLFKEMRQNRPIPHWIRMKLDFHFKATLVKKLDFHELVMQKQLKLDIEIDKEQLQKSLSSLVQMVVALGQFKVIKIFMLLSFFFKNRWLNTWIRFCINQYCDIDARMGGQSLYALEDMHLVIKNIFLRELKDVTVPIVGFMLYRFESNEIDSPSLSSCYRFIFKAVEKSETKSPRFISNRPSFGIAFDIDGVILRGRTPIGDSPKALKRLYDDSGGGIPESRRASELSQLLGVNIDPIQTHNIPDDSGIPIEPSDESEYIVTPSQKRAGRWARMNYKIALVIEKCIGKFVDERKAALLKGKGLPLKADAVVARRTDKGVTDTWREDIKPQDIQDAINSTVPGKLRVICSDHQENNIIGENNSDDVANIDKPTNFKVGKVNKLIQQLERKLLSYKNTN